MNGRRGIVALALIAAVALLAFAIRGEGPPERLTNVYSPTFAPVPPTPPVAETLGALIATLRTDTGLRFLSSWVPSQSGALWISLLLVLLLAIDPERPASWHNLDLIATQILGFLFFDILSFLDYLRRPVYVALMWWVFTGIFWVSVYLIVRATWRAARPPVPIARRAWPGRAVIAAAIVLAGLDVLAAATRPPDDAGYFINLGAQRLRERGLLPYGDPLLTGTPGAGYGPLLYAAHIPFQLLTSPAPRNAVSSPSPPLGEESTYYLPPPLATRLCTIAFHLAGLWALWRAARRYGSADLGWTLVALSAGSAYVLGVGGDTYFIGGMTFISHIAPAALLLAAFALLHRPAAAGGMLVAAAGCGFFPVLLVPAWAGYYCTRRRELVKFAASVVLWGTALGLAVLLLSRPAGGRSLIGTILWDTFGHHTDPKGYGFSPFSFWGQHGGAWMMSPLLGSSALTSPLFLLLAGFALWTFFAARGRSPGQLALLTAAVIIASNLQKVHPTGTYVAWYYPFLLLGFMLPATAIAPREPAPE